MQYRKGRVQTVAIRRIASNWKAINHSLSNNHSKLNSRSMMTTIQRRKGHFILIIPDTVLEKTEMVVKCNTTHLKTYMTPLTKWIGQRHLTMQQVKGRVYTTNKYDKNGNSMRHQIDYKRRWKLQKHETVFRSQFVTLDQLYGWTAPIW